MENLDKLSLTRVEMIHKRGFLSNSTVGGLGTANNLMDPAMLAVIGIVITLGATMIQMVRGS